MITDLQGAILHVNQALCDLTSYSRDELLGRQPSLLKSGHHPPELYRDLWQRIASTGVARAGPAVAYYEDAPAGDGTIVVHAAVPVIAEPGGDYGFSVMDLAEVERAAAIIHHGCMDDVMPTGQALARWIDASGYRCVGYAREVTVEWSPDPAQWVTELQQPIDTTGG